MEYFIMRQDGRYSNCIEPVVPKDALDQEAVKQGALQFVDLRTPVMFYLREKREPDYLDYLEKPFLLISDRLRQLFLQHEKRFFYKPIVMADVKRMRQDYYWLLLPERLDCLTPRSEFHKDRSLKRAVVDCRQIGYCKIFKLAGLLEERLVVDRDVAEAVLAGDFTGVRFEKIERE
jgi:hypothetical protein